MTTIIENVKYFFTTFLKEVRTETSQIIWLDRKKTIALTGVVFLVAAVIGIFLAVVDTIFTALVGLLIK